jgi:type VI secretion system protein ImpM
MHAKPDIRPDEATSIYFGKVRSRGDFVKSGGDARLIAHVDRWLATGIELLAANPGWKDYYDHSEPVDFLFLAPHRQRAISGVMVASSDASRRRFPFAAATLLDVARALDYLSLSPLHLERHSNYQRALAQHASAAVDATEPLAALDGMPLETAVSPATHAGRYRHFLLNTTITGLGNALALDPEGASVRQMVLAVAHLLQPVLAEHRQAPRKGLALPLPCDPARMPYYKALWLDLIGVFLERAHFELGIFSCRHFGVPKLIVTFNGPDPQAIHALFDEQAAADYLIDMAVATWIDEMEIPTTSAKLAAYLEHDDMSLHCIATTFRQCFSSQPASFIHQDSDS